LPTRRPRAKPYCSKSSTVALKRKPPLRLAAGGYVGDGLDEPAAQSGDLVERPLQACPGDALSAMPLVDEDARDPPVRHGWRILVVLALVLDAWKLLRAAVLAPALCEAVPVDDERGMSTPGADAVLLDLAWLIRCPHSGW